MPTNNAWNNTISASGTTSTLNGGTVNIGTDAINNTINVGTGAAVKTVVVGSTNSTSITTVDCGTGGASFGASANAHTTTIGSTNSTSATTVQSGSGALNVTSTNGALTINSGTGTLSVSSDASATTVNIATGAAAKVATLGSTNGASSLALRYGTADFTLASATGTVMSALDTGEITYPLQPAFLAYLATTDTNRTGNGTVFTIGSGTALTEVFDQGGDFVTTGTFTAPVTGKYQLNGACDLTGSTVGTAINVNIVTSNRTFVGTSNSRAAFNGDLGATVVVLADMDAADTATLTVAGFGEAGATEDVTGSATPPTYFSGFLAC